MLIGSKIIFFDNLTSTNSHAIRLLSEERLPEGTIIRAGFQSAGRGQPGNAWESENGKNLLMSLVLYPAEIHPENQFLLSMAVSLGMHEYLNKNLTGVSIKWPNDIYVNDDKIAGILLESSIMGNQIMYMIAGIGLNVNQETFHGNAPNPVSMKMLTGKNHPLDLVLDEVCQSLETWYLALREGHIKQIVKEYNSRLYRLNQWSSYHDGEGDFTGKIKHVDTDGRITVEKKGKGKKMYYFKEMSFIL